MSAKRFIRNTNVLFAKNIIKYFIENFTESTNYFVIINNKLFRYKIL